MRTNYAVSVIVPAYNAEETIKDCLDKIFLESKNIESELVSTLFDKDKLKVWVLEAVVESEGVTTTLLVDGDTDTLDVGVTFVDVLTTGEDVEVKDGGTSGSKLTLKK